METTTTTAMATTGVRHALRAAEARTPSGCAPSNACERMSHTPSTTPSTAINAAMMNVTGMVALTVVYVAPVMREPCWVRWTNTPSAVDAASANILCMSHTAI